MAEPSSEDEDEKAALCANQQMDGNCSAFKGDHSFFLTAEYPRCRPVEGWSGIAEVHPDVSK